MLDKPGVVGIGVGLNTAGKPVIQVYKETDDVAGHSRRRSTASRSSTSHGRHRPRDAARPTASHVPCRSASRPVSRTSRPGRSARASRTARTSTRSPTTTSSPASTRASIGDAIISAGRRGRRQPIRPTASARSRAIQTIDFNGGTNTWTPQSRSRRRRNVGTATPADGYGAPSHDAARPLRSGRRVQKYGRTTGFQLGAVARRQLVRRRLLLRVLRVLLPQEARFVNQISVSPARRSARRATRAR